MDTNKTKKKWKELGIDALFDFAGAFLQAVGVWCFIEPSRIAPGGVSGIALMLNHLFALPIGAVAAGWSPAGLACFSCESAWR